jgi:hypothetical protein
MPIETVGEGVVGALEVADAAPLNVPEPPKRGRVRRFLYWAMIVAGFVFAIISYTLD